MQTVATSSRRSKREEWREILRLHLRERLNGYVTVLTPWPAPTEAHYETTVPASAKELPPPPSFAGGDIDPLLQAYLTSQGTTLGKTRYGRMKKHFKALLLDWFLGYVDLYCPEDTHKLASSYNETFQRALATDHILIQSDLFYAGVVEEMEGVEWQKATAKDHFAKGANEDIKGAIDQFLPRALAFAEA